MENKEIPEKKLHPRNKHHQKYDFDKLVEFEPELKKFVQKNPSNQKTIPFSNPEAVKLLNKAILLSEYQLQFWDLPKNQLCPPIPGRADYIHYLADLLSTDENILPKGTNIRVLDIGVGASLIYPIIGVESYGWSFVGSDINSASLENAAKIITNNSLLVSNVELRYQANSQKILHNIIKKEDFFDAVLCNPPFYKSASEAKAQTTRKIKNLTKQTKDVVNNFGGLDNELWVDGGEIKFISKLMNESLLFKSQVNWFTSLISNKDNIKPLQRLARKLGAKELQLINMHQGNKSSRFIAWKF